MRDLLPGDGDGWRRCPRHAHEAESFALGDAPDPGQGRGGTAVCVDGGEPGTPEVAAGAFGEIRGDPDDVGLHAPKLRKLTLEVAQDVCGAGDEAETGDACHAIPMSAATDIPGH